jgi:hypothetical protein
MKMDFDFAAHRRQMEEQDRLELQQLREALLGKKIVSLVETESHIVIGIEGDLILRFDADSQCCDVSWFVLSDIDKPEGFVGSIFTGYRLVEFDELRGTAYTYGFNIDTTAGTYHVRMSNDGGESGCYSGILSANAFLSGYTHNVSKYSVKGERTCLQDLTGPFVVR